MAAAEAKKPPANFLRDFAAVARARGMGHIRFTLFGAFDGRTLLRDDTGRWELTGKVGATLEGAPETFAVTVVTDQTEDELRDLLSIRRGGMDVPLGIVGQVEDREFTAITGEVFQRLRRRVFALGNSPTAGA